MKYNESYDFDMIDIKHFPIATLIANGITQEMINIINETDLQTAKNTKFTSLKDAKEYFEEMKEGVL